MALIESTFSFQDIPVSYLHGGAGYPLLMIHGSGPGASTLGNWRLVLEPLAERYEVFAMDLIGFGRSGRKRKPPYFDFPLWLDQCNAMLARMPGDEVGVIGHSLSGALALKIAASTKRVSKVMTTATMGAAFQPNESAITAWTFPRDRSQLRKAAGGLIFNKTLIDEEYLANRERILFSGDYESYFSEMFSGDKRRFIEVAVLSSSELKRISCDVLMIHGRNDEGFPAEELTLTIARSIPQADVVLLGRCSHSVAFEHAQKFLSLANGFFG